MPSPNNPYRLGAAKVAGCWHTCRRPATFLLLITGAMLSIHVAHSYSAMNPSHLFTEWHVRTAPSAPPLANSLTRVSIPKIKLDVMLLEGASRSSLLNGPGRLDDTPSSNSVSMAHRDTFFHNLGDLGRGDDIFICRAGHAYHYIVKRKAIVQPNDATVIRPSPQNNLTLITQFPAYYIGPAPQRLVVIAEQIEDSVPN